MEVAREPGLRSKVAVAARQEKVDPVGSCVGVRGVRIQNIVNELYGEKIDVIEWSPDTATFISNALSPAKPSSVTLNEAEKVATVIVPTDQMSLAIGKEGQNARLAYKLTGWRIDIKDPESLRDQDLEMLRQARVAIAEARARTSAGRAGSRGWCAPTAWSPCATASLVRSIVDLVGMSVDVESARRGARGLLQPRAAARYDFESGEQLAARRESRSLPRSSCDPAKRARTAVAMACIAQRVAPSPHAEAQRARGRSTSRSGRASPAASKTAKRALIRIVRTPEGAGRGRSDRARGTAAGAYLCETPPAGSGRSRQACSTSALKIEIDARYERRIAPLRGDAAAADRDRRRTRRMRKEGIANGKYLSKRSPARQAAARRRQSGRGKGSSRRSAHRRAAPHSAGGARASYAASGNDRRRAGREIADHRRSKSSRS